MPITPIGPTHKIVFDYTKDGLTHHCSMLCNAVPSGDSSGYDVIQVVAPNRGVSVIAADWALLVKAIMDTSVTIVGWTLYSYVNPLYIPVATGTLGVAGTVSAGGDFVAEQLTFTFRDNLHKLNKVVLFETSVNAPIKSATGLYTATIAFKNSLVSNADGDLGAWYRGRADTYLRTFKFMVSSLSLKIRRQRGLV